MNEDQKQINNYISTILNGRNYIIRNIIVVVILAVIISLLLPNKYTATSTILPPSSDQTGMFGLLSMNLPSDIAGLSKFMGGGLPGVTTPSDLFAAIMQSSRIKGAIIHRFDLQSEFKTRTMYDTYRQLDEITDVKVAIEGILSVSITYKNKHLAADIANAYIEELDKFNNETSMTAGKKYRIFVEKRLYETDKELAQAEESLKQFQEIHKTIILDEEIKRAIVIIAELKGQIILLEVKKGTFASSSQTYNPYFNEISKELSELKKQLSKIEFGDTLSDQKKFGVGFSIPFVNLPEISLEYARLFREVKIQEVIYEMLLQQYEQAKIMEVKDTPTVQILDQASAPEKKSWPRRTLIVIFSFLISLFGSILLVFFIKFIKDIQDNPKEHTLILKIWNTYSKDINLCVIKVRNLIKKS